MTRSGDITRCCTVVTGQLLCAGQTALTVAVAKAIFRSGQLAGRSALCPAADPLRAVRPDRLPGHSDSGTSMIALLRQIINTIQSHNNAGRLVYEARSWKCLHRNAVVTSWQMPLTPRRCASSGSTTARQCFRRYSDLTQRHHFTSLRHSPDL